MKKEKRRGDVRTKELVMARCGTIFRAVAAKDWSME
jgi:hypothetical protein